MPREQRLRVARRREEVRPVSAAVGRLCPGQQALGRNDIVALDGGQRAEYRADRAPPRCRSGLPRDRLARQRHGGGEVGLDPARARLHLDQDALAVGRVGGLRLVEQRGGLGDASVQREAEREPAEHDRQAIRLVVLPGDRRGAPLRGLGFGEGPPERGAIAHRGQALHRDEPIAGGIRRFDHRAGVGTHSGKVALQALDPGQLTGRQQRLPPVAGLKEEVVRLLAGVVRKLEIARPPGEEIGQPELDDRAPGMVGGPFEQAIDRAQRPDCDRGVRLGAVVDQPLRARVHSLEHLEPAQVVRGQQVHELRLEVERLTERLASLCLTHGVQQHLDRLGIAALGGPGKVQRCLREVPATEQRARRLPVQHPPAGATGRLVDDIAHERVVQLIAQLAATLLLDHDPRRDELGEDRPDLLERAPRQRCQVAQRHRAPHHRQQLQHPSRRCGEPAKLRDDALGQPLGQALQMRAPRGRPPPA